VAEAQTSTPAKSAAKKPSVQPTVASLNAQAQNYLTLLGDVDVTSDPDVKSAVFAKWVDATCQSKKLQFQQSGVDASLGAAIYQSCTKRLLSDPSAALAAVTSKSQSGSLTQGNGKPGTPSPSNQPCVVVASPSTTSGTNTTYTYSVQCSSGVSPNSLAIVTPAINYQVGFALEQGVAKQSSTTDANDILFHF